MEGLKDVQVIYVKDDGVFKAWIGEITQASRNMFIRSVPFDVACKVYTNEMRVMVLPVASNHQCPCIIRTPDKVVIEMLPYTDDIKIIVGQVLARHEDAVDFRFYSDGFNDTVEITAQCYYCGDETIQMQVR